MFINDAYASAPAGPESQGATQTESIIVQNSETTPKAPESMLGNWTSLVPMFLILGVFYFLLIRPQEKRRRSQQDLVSSVKKGEEVLTSSGIIGIVSKINDSDNTVSIAIAKDIEIRMLKTSISDILSRNKKDAPSKEETAKPVSKKVKK